MSESVHSVLVIGAGSIGERHITCFQATNRAKVSICEVNQALRERIADQYRIDNCFETLDEALSSRHDAVVVATPAPSHVPIAQQTCDAGLHALIEKPLSTTLAGLDQLQATIESKQLVAVIAYVLRAHPALAAMKRALDEKRFGKPLQLVAVGGQDFPHYRPAYRDTYYASHASGGGAVQDALTHVINAAEWLIGPVSRLVADAAHLRLEGVDVEDTVNVLARHGEALASYSLNQHQAPNENSITVVCERGAIRFEAHHNRLRWKVGPDDDWSEESFQALERNTLFTTQANRFLDTIEGKAKPLCTLSEGLQTLRCNLAILNSVKEGAWQEIKD